MADGCAGQSVAHDDEAALCRTAAGTCGRCCHGADVSRADLERRAARHARVFARVVGGRPSAPRLLLHEVIVRRGADVVLAPLLLLPGVGDRLRARLRRTSVCAFLASEAGAPGAPSGPSRVACALHPARHGGRDLRRASAFRALRGLGCGEAGWTCAAAVAWARASSGERARFASAARGLGWPEYGRVATSFGATPGRDRTCR